MEELRLRVAKFAWLTDRARESLSLSLGDFCFTLAYDLSQDTCYNLVLCMCVGFEPKQEV